MYKVLLAAAQPEAMARLAAGIEQDGRATLYWAQGEEDTVSLTQELAPDLVVIDGEGREKQAFALVSKLLMVNAMVNTAVVTAMDQEEFHEAGEGLGILMALPPDPGEETAKGLLDKLMSVAAPLQG